MDTARQPSSELSLNPRPFQFSLATVFVLFVLVSLAGGICFALPEGIAAGAVLFLIPTVPALLLTGAMVSSGYWRTFSIGAIFPTVMVLPVLVALIIGPILSSTEAYVLPGNPNATAKSRRFASCEGNYRAARWPLCSNGLPNTATN